MKSSQSTAWNLEKSPFLCHGLLLPQPSIQFFAALLQECTKKGNPHIGLQLHRYMCKCGLYGHGSLGSRLVSMLSELGSMQHAHHIFDRLIYRDDRAWSSLITGYVEDGQPYDALLLYQRMPKDDTVRLCDDHCFVALVKACAKLTDMEIGMGIHAEVSRLSLLETNFIIGSTLVDLYAKCGLLDKAQQVFNKLTTQNVVSWTTLITGYTEHGDGEEALNCFEQMLRDGISPNAITFVCSLKACANIRNASKGQEIHAEIEKHGFMQDIVVGNALVDMYSKCGLLDTACYLFGRLPKSDIVSWTSLISGYVEHGHGEEALKYFQAMRLQGVHPDAFMLVCALRACGSIQAVTEGREIHDEIERQGLLGRNVFLGSALVDMYAKCGLLEKAQKVFDGLQARNGISWNALITGYIEQGRAEEVLELFGRMQDEGLSPNSTTFVCILRACGELGYVDKGQEMQGHIERQGLLECDTLVGNALIDMYVKCGALLVGEDLFDRLPLRDLVSWNALITGYVDHGHSEKALEHFEQMHIEGVSSDSISYICALRACGHVGASNRGREIHCEVSRQGLLEVDAMVGNVVLDMYAKCNLLSRAQQVFHELPIQSAVSWNTLIAGLADCGRGEEALDYYQDMLLEGLLPDVVTLVCILNACGSTQEIDKGRETHAEIERRGLLGEDSLVGNTLIDMYAKCGWLNDARLVFDKLLVRDVVSYNVLLACYAEHGLGEDALSLLEDMQRKGVYASAVTFVWGLKTCADMGAVGKGGELHAEIERGGLLENEVIVGNALVDMYASCGWLPMAQEVFDKLPTRNLVSQTALMAGYAQAGHSMKVFHMYKQMQGEGINPDPITFTVILTACSRNGTYGQSQTYFDAMSKDYGIIPSVEHHGCVTDLLGRVGELDSAFAMTKKMPSTPNLVIWQMVLNACTNMGHVEFGKHAFHELMGKVEGI